MVDNSLVVGSPSEADSLLVVVLHSGAVSWLVVVIDLSLHQGMSLLLGDSAELLLVSSNLFVMSFPSLALSLLVFGFLIAAIFLLFFIVIESELLHETLLLGDSTELLLVSSDLVLVGFPGGTDSLVVVRLLLGAVDLVFIVVIGSDLHKAMLLGDSAELLLVSSDLVLVGLPGGTDSLVILGLLLRAVNFLLIVVKGSDLHETLLLCNASELLLVSGDLVLVSFPGLADSLVVVRLLLGAVDLVFIIVMNLSKSTKLLLVGSNLIVVSFPGLADSLVIWVFFLVAVDFLLVVIEDLSESVRIFFQLIDTDSLDLNKSQ